ncbi:hypothetical protein KC622_02390, partial [Candidatus Dojkabacteria bacterium]|nr:hypothetical protein [Candidatus Dojkabacteria bacterium]
YPIPANDDSIRSISLFLELFAKAIQGGMKADSLLALRKSYDSKLQSLKVEYENKLALKEKMEEEDRERMRKLRAGEEVKSGDKLVTSRIQDGGTVVRVTKASKPVPQIIKKTKKVSVQAINADEKKISDLGLSSRIESLLKDAGVKSVSQLGKMTDSEINAIKGLGQKAVEEIRAALK